MATSVCQHSTTFVLANPAKLDNCYLNSRQINKNIVIGHSLKLNGASLKIPLLITPLLFAFN